jgi:hypothetical protein
MLLAPGCAAAARTGLMRLLAYYAFVICQEHNQIGANVNRRRFRQTTVLRRHPAGFVTRADCRNRYGARFRGPGRRAPGARRRKVPSVGGLMNVGRAKAGAVAETPRLR